MIYYYPVFYVEATTTFYNPPLTIEIGSYPSLELAEQAAKIFKSNQSAHLTGDLKLLCRRETHLIERGSTPTSLISSEITRLASIVLHSPEPEIFDFELH